MGEPRRGKLVLVKSYTNINAQSQPFSADAGMKRLQAAPQSVYGNSAVQGLYDDVSRAAGQKAAMDLSRAATQQSADYTMRANAAQNQAALSGLQLLGQQRQNAYQQQQAQQDMMFGAMGKMNSLLGGLL